MRRSEDGSEDDKDQFGRYLSSHALNDYLDENEIGFKRANTFSCEVKSKEYNEDKRDDRMLEIDEFLELG